MPPIQMQSISDPQKASSRQVIAQNRSPSLNWDDIAHWYNLILNVGRDWHARFDRFKSTHENHLSIHELAKNTESIEAEISRSRACVLSCLLRITEKLLKRPAPISSDPHDIRFLLILLVNPLFHSRVNLSTPKQRLPPTTENVQNHVRKDLDNRRMESSLTNMKDGNTLVQETSQLTMSSNQFTEHSTSHKSPAAQYSSLIKRILGILSNLDNMHHHHIINWISWFTERRFRSVIELIGSFITYRLTRQHDKKPRDEFDPSGGLIPTNLASGQALSAAIRSDKRSKQTAARAIMYTDDWQIKAASKVMQLFSIANSRGHIQHKLTMGLDPATLSRDVTHAARQRAHRHGQILAISDFYNILLDYSDVIADFEAWESRKAKFSFCAYPFFLSIGAKIKILAHDARRQQEVKAREAFFDSIMSKRNIQQYLQLKVRRECLVEDSLKEVAAVVGRGDGEIKKGLRVEFLNEAGIDAGGPRKEWFLLLARDLFQPEHGMFVYDEESHLCYFNPFSFESTDQYFLVGVVLGLAIYNSTILDVALPPFLFRKLLYAGPSASAHSHNRSTAKLPYTLSDLAEFRPSLARGLRHLLEYDGDVEAIFCRDFVVQVDQYGKSTQIPLCEGGDKRAVTSANRKEFVDLYVKYVLHSAVVRQFEPFSRGFWQVCGGNGMSLFQPEELELLLRGSDEPLDIQALRAVALYENWGSKLNEPNEPVVQWFWKSFAQANTQQQRALLSFITGSDRIPATGISNIVIKMSRWMTDCSKYPVARTCFNMLLLPEYRSYEELHCKLWRAVHESEGFALK